MRQRSRRETSVEVAGRTVVRGTPGAAALNVRAGTLRTGAPDAPDAPTRLLPLDRRHDRADRSATNDLSELTIPGNGTLWGSGTITFARPRSSS
jgi:hypothetical protein